MVCKLPAVFLLVPGIFLACTSLKPVQQLSEEARRGLGHFHKLGYNYAETCTMDCTFQKVRTFTVDRRLNCECASYQKADSVVWGLFRAMEQYWMGLSELASPGLTSYDLSAPVQSLHASEFVSLSEGEVSATQKMAEFAVNTSTGRFRSRRILHYMKDADPHLRLLTEKLGFVLEQNLLGLLEIQQEEWYTHYKTQTINSELNAMEKEWATEKHYQLVEDAEKIRLKVVSLVAMLDLIAEKHHSLAVTAEKIGSENFRNITAALSDELKDLYVVFEQVNE